MEEPWKTLEAAGLPDGPVRPAPRRGDFDGIRAALAAIDPAALDDAQAAALQAWLRAWRHHWPSRFEAELGERGDDVLAALAGRALDENRYLKLRRIAVENLAGFL